MSGFPVASGADGTRIPWNVRTQAPPLSNVSLGPVPLPPEFRARMPGTGVQFGDPAVDQVWLMLDMLLNNIDTVPPEMMREAISIWGDLTTKTKMTEEAKRRGVLARAVFDQVQRSGEDPLAVAAMLKRYTDELLATHNDAVARGVSGLSLDLSKSAELIKEVVKSPMAPPNEPKDPWWYTDRRLTHLWGALKAGPHGYDRIAAVVVADALGSSLHKATGNASVYDAVLRDGVRVFMEKVSRGEYTNLGVTPGLVYGIIDKLASVDETQVPLGAQPFYESMIEGKRAILPNEVAYGTVHLGQYSGSLSSERRSMVSAVVRAVLGLQTEAALVKEKYGDEVDGLRTLQFLANSIPEVLHGTMSTSEFQEKLLGAQKYKGFYRGEKVDEIFKEFGAFTDTAEKYRKAREDINAADLEAVTVDLERQGLTTKYEMLLNEMRDISNQRSRDIQAKVMEAFVTGVNTYLDNRIQVTMDYLNDLRDVGRFLGDPESKSAPIDIESRLGAMMPWGDQARKPDVRGQNSFVQSPQIEPTQKSLPEQITAGVTPPLPKEGLINTAPPLGGGGK